MIAPGPDQYCWFYDDDAFQETARPGFRRRVITGDQLQLCFWRIKGGASGSFMHKHDEHEQLGIIARGKLDFRIGEEDSDDISDSDDTLDEGEIESEIMELYARIADVQADLETEVVVEHLDLSLTDLAKDEGYAERIEEQFQALKLNLQQEMEKGLAKIELVDDKILIKLASQDSFESGFAEIKTSFLPTLRNVRNSIKGTPERITISGHTDNVPIRFSDRFQSNWDLSSARASAVADFMRDDPGIDQSRLRVYGFAETRPTTSNDTREGRAENRRIEIEIGQ